MGQHTIPSVLLWICVANMGCFAYIFPTDLINHDTLPEPNSGAPPGDTAPLCEPEGVYTKIDPIFCDRYVSCTYGQPHKLECPDGLAFQPFKGCKPLHQVDCGTRLQLQPPKGNGVCSRLNGVYPNDKGCHSYIRCSDGKAMVETCKGQSIFDDKSKSCRNPTLEEYSNCFLHDPKPTNHNSFSNQQVPSNSFDNQQAPSSSFVNQQLLTNAFDNQQVPLNSLANQQIPSNSLTNQQVPSSTFSNQQVATNSFSNQQASSTSFSNQQQLSSNSFSSQQISANQQRPPVANQAIQTTYRPSSTGYQQTQSGQNTQYNAPNQSVAATSSSSFVCPPSNFFAFGDHNRYPDPGTCHRFYICLRDGSVKVGGCQAPTAFDPISQVCVSMQSVPNCT